MFVEDIAIDPLWADYKHLALPHGLRACWSTPIVDANGRVLGTFAMYYSQPALPVERHLKLIDLATHTAAICLSRHIQVQALRDSESRFRQLAECLPQLVWTCGPDGACDYIARQWLDYTGMPAIACLGLGWTQQVHPADRESALKIWNTCVANGTDFHHEYRIRRHDGTYRWFDTRAVAQRDANGRVVKWVGSNTDIDDRKRFEETQLRSQKLESLGTLAGGIAHDFNNMLLVIQGNAQLAQEMMPADSAAQEHLVEISHASERATDLVRRILSFSRPQKARHKVIALGPVVDEAMKFARAALPTSVELRAKVASQVPMVAADATQIHQILLNLATNGAHAIGPRSGLIEVELAGADIDAEAVACALDNVAQLPPGRYARLTVRDNGCGMSQDVVERIFDPFFTTKPVGQGTGLGLSIVHGIMRSSGGAVTVQSELGKGTAFHLYFPAAAVASPSDSTGVHQALSPGRGQRVLFIDDEDSVVRLATLNLTRMGYRVTGCTEPAAALREFQRDPDAFDAVVTDLSMPGMTGFDCARTMLAVRPELPIVMTSGYIRPEDEALAREIGIRSVCSKPDALRELGELLTQVLASRHPEQGGRAGGLALRRRRRGVALTVRRVLDHLAVGKGDRHEQPALLAIAQRVQGDRHLVAGLQHARLPALALQVVRAVHLDGPLLDLAARIGHVELDERVRVGPLELTHGAVQHDLLVPVEHRERVMSERRAGREQGDAGEQRSQRRTSRARQGLGQKHRRAPLQNPIVKPIQRPKATMLSQASSEKPPAKRAPTGVVRASSHSPTPR